MSTDYYVKLTASDGSIIAVKIIDSYNPLPFSDTWEGEENALGNKTGKVASWGMDAIVLHTGPGAVGNVTLDKFAKGTTKKGDSGTGSKSSDIGTFPDGDLRWYCEKVD